MRTRGTVGVPQVGAKLVVGAADDRYEREADRVAAMVMRVLASPTHPATPAIEGQNDESLHRRRAGGTDPTFAVGAEPEIVGRVTTRLNLDRLCPELEAAKASTGSRPPGSVVRAMPASGDSAYGADGHQLLSTSRAVAPGRADRQPRPLSPSPMGPDGGAVDDATAAQITRPRRGEPLETATRRQMDSAFGSDFSRVRVHTDPHAHDLTRRFSALAFTAGPNIFFARGTYAPNSSTGQRLLAHELAHVVQQGHGQLLGVPQRRVQRLLVRFGTDPQTLTNERHLRELNPIEYRGGSIESLVPGEVLHLLAHADKTSFDEFKRPESLFDYLKENGLKESVKGIHLHGCESSAFASQLYSLVNTTSDDFAWVPFETIEVLGFPGYHFVSTEGRSYSVGATKGNDALWERIGLAIRKDPSEETIDRVRKKFVQSEVGELIALDVLESSAQALDSLRETVRTELQRKVERVPDDPFAQQDLSSLWRMVSQFMAIIHSNLTPLPAYDIQGQVSANRGALLSKLTELDVEANPPPVGIDLDLAPGTQPAEADEALTALSQEAQGEASDLDDLFDSLIDTLDRIDVPPPDFPAPLPPLDFPLPDLPPPDFPPPPGVPD